MGRTLPGHDVQRSEKRENVTDVAEMKGRAGIGDFANFVVVGDVQIISTRKILSYRMRGNVFMSTFWKVGHWPRQCQGHNCSTSGSSLSIMA